ncbi:MAG TPA: Type 1 glutamine amidotransferase-like domain-containing protein [Acidimicrobiales bacterium]|nr:Type 1 glutamine amidotransferase-like domain-containing protein [Acidimicrobiales bacterium]
MKFLLTSSGISNPSINDALVDLLGKPIAESSALCIPTGTYPFPNGAEGAYRFIRGVAKSHLSELGWKSLGVLELTALPSIKESDWVPVVQETDALLVWGGEPLYLCYWMRQSGLANLLTSMEREIVYVGVSGGSMVVAPNFGVPYDGVNPPVGSEEGMGWVDFAMIGHLDNPDMPDFSLAGIEEWAAGVPGPAYGTDDETAIKVVDGTIEIVSEGHWKLFTPRSGESEFNVL